jgi:hypothetical protein
MPLSERSQPWARLFGDPIIDAEEQVLDVSFDDIAARTPLAGSYWLAFDLTFAPDRHAGALDGRVHLSGAYGSRGAATRARLRLAPRMPIRPSVLAAFAFAFLACQPPPELSSRGCEVCVTADRCCAAHTANPGSNCQLFATCLMFTGEERASVADGCAYYLRVASTPPAPSACGEHPDAD